MRYIKQYESFGLTDLSERLERFSEGAEEIINAYKVSQFNLSEFPEIKSVKDIYNLIKSAPTDLINFARKIYSENKERINELGNEFNRGLVTEEICLLNILCIGLLCFSLWKMFGTKIKKSLGLGPWHGAGGAKTDYIDDLMGKKKGGCGPGGCPTSAPSQTTSTSYKTPYNLMSKTQLQKELDKALDKGDMKKVGEISKYL